MRVGSDSPEQPATIFFQDIPHRRRHVPTERLRGGEPDRSATFIVETYRSGADDAGHVGVPAVGVRAAAAGVAANVVDPDQPRPHSVETGLLGQFATSRRIGILAAVEVTGRDGQHEREYRAFEEEEVVGGVPHEDASALVPVFAVLVEPPPHGWVYDDRPITAPTTRPAVVLRESADLDALDRFRPAPEAILMDPAVVRPVEVELHRRDTTFAAGVE